MGKRIPKEVKNQVFADLLNRLIEEKGFGRYTQEVIAHELGMSSGNFSRLRRGLSAHPKEYICDSLAEFFDVDVNLFLKAAGREFDGSKRVDSTATKLPIIRTSKFEAVKVRIELDDPVLEEKIFDLLADHPNMIWFDPVDYNPIACVMLGTEQEVFKEISALVSRAPHHEIDRTESESVILLRNLVKAASDVVEHKETRETFGIE